jgi:hypothetical protein
VVEEGLGVVVVGNGKLASKGEGAGEGEGEGEGAGGRLKEESLESHAMDGGRREGEGREGEGKAREEGEGQRPIHDFYPNFLKKSGIWGHTQLP